MTYDTDLARRPAAPHTQLPVAGSAQPPLVRGLLIDGEGVDTGTTADVLAVHSRQLVGRVAQASATHVDRAIQVAHGALARPLPAHQRAEILDRVADLLLERADLLVGLLVAEVGKPTDLARQEVERGAATYRFSASVARSLTGRTIPLDAAAAGTGRLAFTRALPLGVVVAITPFNWPINLVAHKLGPALAAGCPVVLKPAPQCPLTAMALADLSYEAGLPPEYLSVVPGDAGQIGPALLGDGRVAAISFTGSVSVGWHIAREAATKRVLLELGNASPAIVCADADVPRAAGKLAPSAFSYAGQTCVSTQRVFVADGVWDHFVESFLAATAALVVGDPAEPGVLVGPLIDERSVSRVSGWVQEAIAGGAELLAGGQRRDDGLLAPVVLTGPARDAKVMQEEVFGPVVALTRVKNLQEAIAAANDTRFGLQAAVFTDSIAQAVSAAEQLNFGGVIMNDAPSFRADQMPYGGVKDSGNTREGPAYTAGALTQERLIVL